jgi:hypothetical protein
MLLPVSRCVCVCAVSFFVWFSRNDKSVRNERNLLHMETDRQTDNSLGLVSFHLGEERRRAATGEKQRWANWNGIRSPSIAIANQIKVGTPFSTLGLYLCASGTNRSFFIYIQFARIWFHFLQMDIYVSIWCIECSTTLSSFFLFSLTFVGWKLVPLDTGNIAAAFSMNATPFQGRVP